MHIYITGDSYCFYRDDHQNHWPLILANLLGLKLEGQGYPGEGWWPSRQHIVDYAQSPKFNLTEWFIFCHTDIHRPLTSNKHWVDGFTDELQEFYLKYLSDSDFATWATAQWYQELGNILPSHKVIHLNCFDSNQHLRRQLTGKVIDIDLLDISVTDHSNSVLKYKTRLRTPKLLACMNNSHNHLTSQGNQNLAKCLYNSICSGTAFDLHYF